MAINNKLDFDIIIVGGGIVGQTLALLLAKRDNLGIALVDAPSDGERDARLLAINLSTESLWRELNVWQRLVAPYPFKQTLVWDNAVDTRLAFHTKHHDDLTEHLGHIVKDHEIIRALAKEIKQTHITTLSRTLTGIMPVKSGYRLRLEDEQTLTCSLLIGADGAQSNIRQWAHIDVDDYDYQQYSITATLSSQSSFEHNIYQWFSEQGIIALLPYAPTQCGLVWSCDVNTADALMAQNESLFIPKFASTFNPIFRHHDPE